MMLQEMMKRLRDSDPQVRYSITFLYEAFNEQQKQLEMLTNVAAMLAQQNEDLLRLIGQKEQKDIMERVKQIQETGKTEGVEVSSVAPDPDKGEVN